MIIKQDPTDIIKAENLKHLTKKLQELHDSIEDIQQLEEKTIELFMMLLIEHGKSKNSIMQISEISRVISEGLGMEHGYVDVLTKAAKIYDIGNIAISLEIYKKDETLSFEEFEIVKNHTRFGEDILKLQHYQSTDMGAVISLQHHEWWNGGGYPLQLKEEEIDISSRIVALADTIGALFHARPGRKAWEFNKIVEYIKTRDGLQFDPAITEVFMAQKMIIHAILQTDFR